MEELEKKDLPKVLVVGINAWRKNSGVHTLTDIFSCWDKDRLAHIYTRADLPNTNVCSRFFQISENDVLKSVVKPWKKVGKEVFNVVTDDNNVGKQEEQERYAKARKKHSYLMTILREMVWALGHWRSKKLKTFVKEFNPDIVFCPIYPTVFMGKLQRYIKRISGNKPIVCYLADDNYSYESCKGFLAKLHRYALRKQVKYLATHCKEMFVIVDKEKEETDRLFGTDSVILTKGIDFSNFSYKEKPINSPIRFVYTGKLIIGRDKTLALIADALNEINKDGLKATLKIYSPDVPEESVMKRLNSGSSKHCGVVPREKVKEIQDNADVVIFAEALEGKEANTARLSFSTKITDYLYSGKCIFAVGKNNIAPIEYFIKNDSATVATTREEIKEKLCLIIEHKNMIVEYGRKAFDCAKRNHEKTMMDERFINTMQKALDKKIV